MKVYVIGLGMTNFEKPGRRDNFDYPDMALEATRSALEDSGLEYSDIQRAFVGYCYGDSCCGQKSLYQLGMTGEFVAVNRTIICVITSMQNQSHVKNVKTNFICAFMKCIFYAEFFFRIKTCLGRAFYGRSLGGAWYRYRTVDSKVV